MYALYLHNLLCCMVINLFLPYYHLRYNEQSVPSESYLQEVKEQLEDLRKEHKEIQESQPQRKTRSASDGTGKI